MVWIWTSASFGTKDGLRPQMVNLNQCEGILIEDVTLLRSPFWVIHPLLSTDITVRGVHINNDGPNGDGCDPESCDRVLIENCYFNTGDDCIAIKSGRNNDGREGGQGRFAGKPSKNIIIRNCKFNNGHGGVVIGSEISGGCQNVFAENCEMDSPSLDRVLRIKTNSCRGGIIENINMRNMSPLVSVVKPSSSSTPTMNPARYAVVVSTPPSATSRWRMSPVRSRSMA